MRKPSIKTILTLLMAIAMLVALVSCTQKPSGDTGNKAGDGTGIKAEKLFDASIELSMVIGSHASWPYNENWVFWKYLREAVGGTINLQVIPNTEIDTKVTLMMASPKELPDLIHVITKATADKFSPSGALIAIDDNLDKMPNYTKFWDSIPNDERENLLTRRESGDGKTYYPQNYGMERSTNVRAWLYRKDIFEKNGLTTPKTMDELYTTALKLKKLYPDSYPLCMRSGLSNISVIGPEWKPYFTHGVYYDFTNKKWIYGATEQTMLEIVKFLKKMRDEGLVTPDYLTIKSKAWEELVSNDRGFMMPEYQTRIDFFNIPAHQTNSDFKLDVMVPPSAGTSTGQNMVAKFNVDPTGFIICNTGNQKRIDNAIKLVDWFYSDAAADLLSWGKKDETYKVINGKREFIFGEGENASPRIAYGAHTYGLYLRILPEAADAVVSKEQASTTNFAFEHTEEKYNPASWLALNDEEIRVKNDTGGAIDSFRDEMLSKFLLGQEPITKWDAFQAELKAMGVEDLLAVYESAYNRIKNAE